MTKKNTKTSKPKAKPAAKSKPKAAKPAAKPTPSVDSDALLAFLAKRAGGVNRATTAFIRDTMAALVKSGATFGAILAQAEAEGWAEVLATTPVKSVLATPVKGKATGASRNGRLKGFRDTIVKALAAGPMTAAELSAEIGEADRKRLSRQLAKLAEAGQVNAEGSRRHRTYSVA